MSTPDEHPPGAAPPGVHRATATDARQGLRAGWVWRVLLVSVVMAAIAMALVWGLTPEP